MLYTDIDANNKNIFNSAACQVQSNAKYTNYKSFLDLLNSITNEFVAGINKNIDNTYRLTNLEKLKSTNKKLYDLQKEKLDLLNENLNQLHSDQFHSARQYASYDYNINKYQYILKRGIYTLFAISLVFLILGYHINDILSAKITYALITIVILAILLYYLLSARINIYRRKYDWNKFYFASMAKKTII